MFLGSFLLRFLFVLFFIITCLGSTSSSSNSELRQRQRSLQEENGFPQESSTEEQSVSSSSSSSSSGGLPSTKIAEWYGITATSQIIDPTLFITEVVGGNITGEGIYGEFISPGADWLTLGANSRIGTLDIRVSAQMDDGSLMYVEYKGRIRFNTTNFATE